MRVLLAGLWARRGLNTAVLLVAVMAISASVLGPMYGRTSAEHLLDSRIEERAPYVTGLSYAVPALPALEVPTGDPDRYEPPAPGDLVSTAAASVHGGSIERYWHSARAWLLDNGGQLTFSGSTFQVPLYWREGMCDLAQVQGQCPRDADDVLMQATMAGTLGLSPGDGLTLSFVERWVEPDSELSDSGIERERVRKRRFTLVGTYRVADPATPEWFDLSRFTGLPTLVPPPAKGGGGTLPSAPALLTAPGSMTSQSFVGGVDRPIDRHAVDLEDLDQVRSSVEAFRTRAMDSATAEQFENLDVATLFDEVRDEQSMLSEVTLAALAPLVVLALLLIYALVSSATQLRRPYIALAKLRGQSRGQVLRFALSEPYLLLAVAVPLGVLLAWAAARVMAATWLLPGIPVSLDVTAAAALSTVTVAALAAATVASLAVIREPLAQALASSVRPRPASRWSLVLRSAVVAVAVVSVAQLVTSGPGSVQLLGLVAPLFIALATATAGVFLLGLLSRWWVRRTRDGGGTARYLASRRLTRRQDLTRLMIPLLLAVSVLTFAASASATADDWRVSRAKAQLGAPRVFTTDAEAGRLLQVTHDADPKGRYLAAVAAETSGDDLARRLLVDSSRLGTVAAWDESWSDTSLAELQRRLTAASSEPITFRGERVSVDLRDVRLTTDLSGRPALWLQYADDTGAQRDVELGALVDGPSRTLTADLTGCAQDCVLEQLYVSGSSASVSDAQGELTVAAVSVDGAHVDWGLTDDGAWRPARPFPVSLVDPPVVLTPGPDGLRVRVYLHALPPAANAVPVMLSGIARITPAGTPDVLPAVVTSDVERVAPPAPTSESGLSYSDDVIVGTALNGGQVPMRVVATTDALPGLGDEGTMADLRTALVEFEPPSSSLLEVRLWAAQDTPPAVLDAVRDAGVVLTEPRRLDTTLEALRSDAFSTGWRIFLLVGAATLLLAVFGVLASAVAQSRWRAYEVASLRVVGLRESSLVRASVLEHVVMLGVAVLLGLVSAFLALSLVLPSIDLGTAGPYDPAATYRIHWEVVAATGGSLFLLATVIAFVVSRRVTRLGRPSILRWAEQG